MEHVAKKKNSKVHIGVINEKRSIENLLSDTALYFALLILNIFTNAANISDIRIFRILSAYSRVFI